RRRETVPHAPAHHVARGGAGVHQRRRARRGDAPGHPPAQAGPRPQRAQAHREGRAGGLSCEERAMANLRVEYPLGSMSKEDAKARMAAMGEYFTNKHGIQVTWKGDAADVRGKYMVVSIEGSMFFEGNKAVFDGKDPGFLWRGKAKDY